MSRRTLSITRRWQTAITAFTLAVVAVCALAQTGVARLQARTASASKGTVKIIDISDLTGQLSFLSGAKAVSAYVQQLNKTGGIDGAKVQLVTLDGQSTAAGTLNAAREAIQQKPAGIIVSSNSESVGSALKALASSGIPTTGLSSDPGWLGPKNLFPISGDLVLHSSNSWLRVLTKQGRSKIAVLGVNGLQATVAIAQKTAAETGATVVYTNTGVPLVPDSASVLSIAQAIQASGANGVVMYGNGGELFQIALNQLHANADVIEPTAVGPALLKQYGSQINGLIYAGTFAGPYVQHNRGVEEYLADMKAAGASADDYVALAPAAFASTVMLTDGLKAAGAPFKHASVVAAMNHFKNYTADGLLPSVSFPQYHETGTACVSTAQVRNGKWVSLVNGQDPFTCGTSGAISVTG